MSRRLFNAKELAAELNVSVTYVHAMKKDGFEFTHGMRTLLEPAMIWLAENKDFRVRRAYPKMAVPKKNHARKDAVPA